MTRRRKLPSLPIMLRIIALFFAAVIAVFLVLAQPHGRPTHQIFLGGEIVLPGGEVAEALYVRDGRITAIGSRESVMDAAPWWSKRIDLDGGALTAGLIEPHTHPLAAAMLGAAVDVSGITHARREDMIAALAAAVDERGPTPWVIAFGWDPAMIAGLEAPTRTELDALSPDRPLVILTQMMHEAFANTAALDAAGITRDTPDPPGGHFERDAAGEPTGRIVEVGAIRMLMEAAPETPDAALQFLLGSTFAEYARAGYTTIGVAALVGRADEPLDLFTRIAMERHTPLNSVLYTIPADLERARGMWAGADQESALRRYAGIKFWMDGSPYVGGAALAEPYARSDFTEAVLGLPEQWFGELLTDPETALTHLRAANAHGLQVAIHAQGETAIEAALDAIAQAPGPASHRLEHLALITPEEAARAERLGVSLGFFVDHVRFYGHMLPDLVGEERTARYMPVAGTAEVNSTVTLHADNPATPIDALRVMETAVERRTRIGTAVIGADQRVSRLQALDMMTINAARQLGIDAETGSIEIGKRADLTWFSANPLTAPGLSEIEVRGTWVSGRRSDLRPWSLPALGRTLRAAWAMLF